MPVGFGSGVTGRRRSAYTAEGDAYTAGSAGVGGLAYDIAQSDVGAELRETLSRAREQDTPGLPGYTAFADKDAQQDGLFLLPSYKPSSPNVVEGTHAAAAAAPSASADHHHPPDVVPNQDSS